MWPFDTRLRAELDAVKANLAAVKADRERIRKERNQFLADRDTQKAVARKATEQYADLYDQHAATAIVNNRLTEDLTAVREQFASPAIDWPAKYEAEKKRADAAVIERDAHAKQAYASGNAQLRLSGELATAKDVIASHVAALTHPTTVPGDAAKFAKELLHALAAAGISLRAELARHDGSAL